MNYRIVEKGSFKIVGFMKRVSILGYLIAFS